MADIIKLNSQILSDVENNEVEDPKIIKIAKLALIIADKETEDIDKLGCIKLAVRMGYITKEEGAQLFAYRPELEEFMEESTEGE